MKMAQSSLGLNVHIYPSAFEYESRILKVTKALIDQRVVARILIIAMAKAGLPARQQIDGPREVLRVSTRSSGERLWFKALRFLEWSARVVMQLRHDVVDMVNCHSLSVFPLCVVLKWWHKCILIYEPHELETETSTSRGIRKRIAKWVERSLIGQADHCIFVGRAIEEWYIREYRLAKTAVLYNCPNHKDVQQSDYFRETYAVSNDKRIFLYQGMIGEGRGIRILVEAFSKLADRAVLVVMGYGPLVDWVVEQTTKYKNIHFHPAVPPENLFGYTCAADYGLSVIESGSMSYEYCMPNKLFEYIMAQKPVLVSPNTEQRNFVERYGVGEVAINISPEAVQQAAVRLMDRPPASYAAGIDLVRDEYCWERQEKKLKEIFVNAPDYCIPHNS